MCNSTSIQIVRFFRFMRLFRVTLFSIISIETKYINAIVAWNKDYSTMLPDENDTQMVRWYNNKNKYLDDALTLGECAYELGGIDSDIITIDIEKMLIVLGWNLKKCELAFKNLKEIKVSMIDNNEESDFFFLHE